MSSSLTPTLILFLLQVLFLACMAQGKVHHHDFVLKEKNYTRLCSTKSMLVVNEQLPGPVIYVNKGDTVYVNVHNQGSYGVTLHWHGVKQPRNPWSDGPEYVTQCPIQAGTNLTYEVVLSDEEGTLWWHAHSNWTRNSVHGAIVIYPPQGEPYPYPKQPDAEDILVLGSWYTYDVNLLVEYDLLNGNDLPISSAYTINTQPGDFCNCSKEPAKSFHDVVYHSVIGKNQHETLPIKSLQFNDSDGGDELGLTDEPDRQGRARSRRNLKAVHESTYRTYVDYGKTYLFRIVNGIMNAENFFSIAGHRLTVVGMDGAYLKPFVSSYLMIAPGQTMDVLVTADQTPSEYYIAIRQYYTDKAIFTEYDKTNTTAILEYRGNYTAPASPSYPDHTLPSFTDYTSGIRFLKLLRSLSNDLNVPKNITTQMFVTTAVNQFFHNDTEEASISLASSLNNVTWIIPTVDVLQAYYSNMSGFYTDDFPDEPPHYYDFIADDLGTDYTQPLKGTKVKVVEHMEQVEIILQSTNVLNASEDHPMHLHGHSFYVVGFGLGIFDNDTDPQTYNLVDPPYVNTASLPKNGWLTIRFVANNPGVWLWHCHLDRHLSWGMNTVFIVKNGDTPETSIRDPPVGMPTCEGASSTSIRLHKRTSLARELNSKRR